MTKRSVKIGTQRYLVQLEPYFWQSIDEILEEEKIKFSFLCSELNRLKGNYPLTKAIRIFTLIYFRNSAGIGSKQPYPHIIAEESAKFQSKNGEEYPSPLMTSLQAFSQYAEREDRLADPV